MSNRYIAPWTVCGAAAWAALLAVSASAEINVTQNIAFTANGRNPWGPGNALEVGDTYTLLDIPLNPPPPTLHVDLPAINANPVDAALDALGDALGVPLPSLVKLKFGGSATGSAHIAFEYFASLGRLNINYPARSTLSLPDVVRSNTSTSIASAFQPGVSNREVGLAHATQIGGIGYGEPILGGLKLTTFNTPGFATTAPYAEAKLIATAEVRAGLYTEVSALAGLKKWRKDINFGGPVGGPLIEIDPSGLYVAGQDTGLFSLTQPISVPLPGIGTATVTYPKLGLSGAPNAPNSPVLHGQNVSEVFRVDADLEKLIPLIGPVLHNSIAGLQYDLLHISGAPVVSVYQDQTFTPDPRVQLRFSEPVLVGGQVTYVAEFGLGQTQNWQPLFSNSNQITIVPLYILNNTFRNVTGLDFSLEVDLDAIGFDAPFLPEYVGPLINPDPVNVPLFRVPLLEPDPWQINLDIVTGAAITVPKLNIDQVSNLGDLRLTFTELVSGTPGTGDATYTLHFNRSVVGGPPREYQATVAGVGSVLQIPFGEGFIDSGVFKANQDVVLTDPVTSEQHNIGRSFCLNGCDLSQIMPGPAPAFIVEDPNNPGQFLPPLYVTTLPDIPDTSVDTANHPILGQPDTSNVNAVTNIEYGTDIVDLRAGPATTILARTRDFAPEGDAQISFVDYHPGINDFGSAVFNAYLDTIPAPGFSTGIYLADGSGVDKVARDGDPLPGGVGFIGGLGETAVGNLNNAGQSVFRAPVAGYVVIRSESDGGLTEIARTGQAVPGGGESFGVLFDATINEAGQVLFLADLQSTPPANARGIYVGDGQNITKIVRTGDSLPGLTAPVNFLSDSFSFNDSGEASFTAYALPNEGGIFVGNGSLVTPIAVQGAAVPQNGTILALGNHFLNNAGEVTFAAFLNAPPVGGHPALGIYRGDGNGLVKIARVGDPAPDNDGIFAYVQPGAMNDAGRVAFFGTVDGPSTSDYSAYYLSDGNGVTRILRPGMTAPDGNGEFSLIAGNNPALALNNEGHLAFVGQLQNTVGGDSDNEGIFVYDGTNIVQVARKGQPLAGSSITYLGFNNGLNNEMQVAYHASLADGRQVIARFEPEMYWRNPGNGNWATGANWSLRVEPTNPYDVFIVAENAFTVTGPAVNRTVKSLTIGGEETASATFSLASGVTLTATNGTTIRPNGVVTGFGKLAGTVTNHGTISPGASPGILHIDGDYTQTSTGTLLIEIASPSSYDQLSVSGDVTLGGTLSVSLLGGYIPTEGQTFSIFGDQFDAIVGAFDSVAFPTFNGLTFAVSQSLNSISLQVVESIGDFNHNGLVDAADYIVWRKGFGTTYTQIDYNTWRAHFGQTSSSGSSASANAAVPEPATPMLLMFAVAGWYLRRGRAA